MLLATRSTISFGNTRKWSTTCIRQRRTPSRLVLPGTFLISCASGEIPKIRCGGCNFTATFFAARRYIAWPIKWNGGLLELQKRARGRHVNIYRKEHKYSWHRINNNLIILTPYLVSYKYCCFFINLLKLKMVWLRTNIKHHWFWGGGSSKYLLLAWNIMGPSLF